MTDLELTRLAAEKVMGWPSFDLGTDGYWGCPHPKLIMNIDRDWIIHRSKLDAEKWHPLTDWRAAGEIVEAALQRGLELRIVAVKDIHGTPVYDVDIDDEELDATSDSGPRAITIAALLAVAAITEDQL